MANLLRDPYVLPASVAALFVISNRAFADRYVDHDFYEYSTSAFGGLVALAAFLVLAFLAFRSSAWRWAGYPIAAILLFFPAKALANGTTITFTNVIFGGIMLAACIAGSYSRNND